MWSPSLSQTVSLQLAADIKTLPYKTLTDCETAIHQAIKTDVLAHLKILSIPLPIHPSEREVT